jgi:hypothetical protein
MGLCQHLLQCPDNALQVKGNMGQMPMSGLTDQAQAVESYLVRWAWKDSLVHCTTILPVMWGCTEQ